MLKDRTWAAIGLGVGVLYLGGPSQVPLNLWTTGPMITVIIGAWLIVLVALIVQPECVRAHYAAAFLSVIVYGGRAGGFAVLLIEADRPDLLTAVVERVALAAGAAVWHWRAITLIHHRALLELHDTYLRAVGVLDDSPLAGGENDGDDGH